jgi:hypothetical protein
VLAETETVAVEEGVAESGRVGEGIGEFVAGIVQAGVFVKLLVGRGVTAPKIFVGSGKGVAEITSGGYDF